MLSRIGHLTRAALTIAATTLVWAAVPATASANPLTTGTTGCEPKVSAPVFIQFGDLRDYYLAPGGSFEGGISWARGGAVSLAAKSEPWALAGLGHTSSALLDAGGSITSPKLCVTRDEPFMRFVGRYLGGGQLDVTVRVYDAYGRVTDTSSGSVSPGDHDGWAPSRLVDLKTSSWAAGQTGYVDLTFASQGKWQIDDVFIDPYRY